MKNELSILASRDCICVNKQIYIFTEKGSMPVCVDCLTEDITFLPIDSTFDKQKKAIDLMINVEQKIYAVEMSGEHLIEFDIEFNKFRYIDLNCNFEIDRNVILMEHVNGVVYLFTRTGKKLVMYDIEQNSMEYISYPEGSVSEYSCGIRIDNDIWVFPKEGKEVLCFNIIDREWNKIILKEKLQDCIHVAKDNKNILILEKKGVLINYDITDGNILWKFEIESKDSEESMVSRILCTNKKLVILPSQGTDIYIYDKFSQNLEKYNEYPEEFHYLEWKWSKYYGYCEDEEKYYCSIRISNAFLTIDKDTGEIEWILPNIQEKHMLEHKIFVAGGMIKEEVGELKSFIKYVCK